MMTSSNGNIFRVTGHLCGEFPRFPGNSSHKGQWRRTLMFSSICAWINDWVNNREAGDLRRYRTGYDVIVMINHPPDLGNIVDLYEEDIFLQNTTVILWRCLYVLSLFSVIVQKATWIIGREDYWHYKYESWDDILTHYKYSVLAIEKSNCGNKIMGFSYFKVVHCNDPKQNAIEKCHERRYRFLAGWHQLWSSITDMLILIQET